MPEKETLERAREDAREGKSPSTQAGEFVRRRCTTFVRGNMVPLRPSRPLRSGYPRRGARE